MQQQIVQWRLRKARGRRSVPLCDVADAFLRLKAWFTHSRLAKKTKQAARARTSGGDKGAKPPVRV